MTLLQRVARRHRDRSRGQALLEFAFVLPMFVLLLLMLFDFGRVVYTQHTLTEDARNAARVGVAAPDVQIEVFATQPACVAAPYQCLYNAIRHAAGRFSEGTGLDTLTEVTGAAGSCVSHGTGLPNDTVSPGTCFYPSEPVTNGSAGGIDSGGRVVVNISHEVQIITPIISNLVGGSFTVTAQAISVMP